MERIRPNHDGEGRSKGAGTGLVGPLPIQILLLGTFLLTALVLPHSVLAQSTIIGTVRDSTSTEPLPNAFVSLDGGRFRALTDEFGKFSFIAVPPGEHLLRVESLGYRPVETTVDPRTLVGEVLSIAMEVEVIEVEAVTVLAERQVVEVTEKVSEVTVSPEAMKALLSVGEADLFRSIQLLPGVSGTNDASSGLYVRGGTPDENLVLLDGMTVYHVDHFFGVFSALNTDAIKDVRLYKGAFPSRYGGRTSSVVELVGKTGSTEGFSMSSGLNLLSARTVLEMPISDKGSFLVSARRSYTDLIQSGVYDDIFGILQGADDTSTQGAMGFGRGGRFAQAELEPSFYFYDFNAKATLSPTDRDVVAVSF